MNPHRTAEQPKCHECEVRAETAAKMQPFNTTPTCPACRTGLVRKLAARVCVGGDLRPGFFRTEWCNVMRVSHFHMVCGNCEHRWLMRTALDTPTP